MRVILIYTNRWWDIEIYFVENPTEEALKIIRTGYVPDVEDDVPFPHTSLEHLLERIEWQACRTREQAEIKNVDLVVFCGGTL